MKGPNRRALLAALAVLVGVTTSIGTGTSSKLSEQTDSHRRALSLAESQTRSAERSASS